MNQSEEILALNSVSKRFPGVLALDNVSFSLRRGEAHALCGENGAGKSTLMKVMSGVYQADEGELVYKGKVCSFGSSVDAEAAGIAIIHQELNLIPHLSVAENIFLAREPVRGFFIDRKKMRARCAGAAGPPQAAHRSAPAGEEPVRAPSSRWWKSPRPCR